jgi:glycosyltransferase involved in cell wall biosynthesis
VRNTLRATFPAVADVLMRSESREVDLLWLSQSRISAAVPTLVRAQRVACRLSDDWEHFDNIPPALLAAERELLRRADVVFATSRRLVEKVRGVRADVFYLPNGVDESFFGAGDAPPPAVLEGIAAPRVVFVGTLGPWVDAERIAETARRCGGASVVLVGPGLPGRPLPGNVHAVGPQPFESIPAILRHSDVAIIPFARNALTASVSPVKLYEYLATGIPVVATRLEEIEAAGSPAVLAGDAVEFAEAVASQLANPDAWSRDRAVAWARGHTWASRFAQVQEALA